MIAAHLLAVAAFGIVMYDQRGAGEEVCCDWLSPGLHPVLMMFGFVWIGPWGALAYVTYEQILGLPHFRAKMLHFMLQTLALIQGILGFVTKYDSVSPTHFRTIHSQMGIMLIGLYAVQWLGGFVSFVLPNLVSIRMKRKMVPIHAFLGCVALCSTVAVVVTGVVAYKGFKTNTDDMASWERFCAAAFLTFFMAVAVIAALVLNRDPDLTVSDRKPLVNEQTSKYTTG